MSDPKTQTQDAQGEQDLADFYGSLTVVDADGNEVTLDQFPQAESEDLDD